MADPVLRGHPIYYNGKKVAEAFQSSLNTNAGREPTFGSEGFFGHTQGAVMQRLEFTVVVPVGGCSIDFLKDTILQKNVDIGILAGNILQTNRMAIIENTLDNDTEKGRLTGKLTLGGGPPKMPGVS